MAQKKKSSKNRQGNLAPLPLKQPKVSRWPTVEDVTDSEEESEDNDFIPMNPIDSSDLSGDESEIEMESEDEDNGFEEIQSDAKLMASASRLQKHITRWFKMKMKKSNQEMEGCLFRQVQTEVEARGKKDRSSWVPICDNFVPEMVRC
jgi:hypothetical protein